MAKKLCNKCGAELLEGAKFCSKCRFLVTEEISAAEKVEMNGFCTECGAELIKGAAFCSKCRKPVNIATPKAPAPAEQKKPTESINNAAQIVNKLSAPSVSGEFSIDISGVSDCINAVSDAAKILSPIKTIFTSVTGFVHSIKNTVKDPKALIGTIIMIVIWVVSWLWNRSQFANKISEILSAVTFAEGGTRGTASQVIGGIFGKGVVMTAFASLFSGGFGRIVKGVKGLFGKGMQAPILACGIGLAVMLHQFFAGYSGTYGISAAVCAAVLSLQALGGRCGFIRRFAESVTSRKLNQERFLNDVKLKSLLSGLTAGFALSAALSAIKIYWWIGLIIVVIGFILSLIFKGKETAA